VTERNAVMLAGNSEYEVRIAVLKNENVSEKIISDLQKDKNKRVKLKAERCIQSLFSKH